MSAALRAAVWHARTVARFHDVELADLELTTERLLIRRWGESDAPRVRTVLQDASMHEHLALPNPYTAEVARQFVTRGGHEGRDEGTGVGCAVVERESGLVVGSAALRLRDEHDVGYWIATDSRGHGYAAEVARALAGLGFGLGLPVVRLLCDVGNLPSARTALNAGFVFEAIAAVGGPADRVRDLARFARRAEDPPGPIAAAFAPLPSGGLRDDVLAVRYLQPGDEAELLETDDELTLRVGFGGPAHTLARAAITTARARLTAMVGTVMSLAMVDLRTGRLAGSLTLRQAGPPQIGGIGYVVHPSFRGRGYAARALSLLVPWAFEQGGFARLELGAKTTNVASQRSALAAGFHAEGVWPGRLRDVDGTFCDEARFGLLNPQLPAPTTQTRREDPQS